jgi:hypothetical protein
MPIASCAVRSRPRRDAGRGATLAEVILSLDPDEDERGDLLSDLGDLHDQLGDYGVEGCGRAH